MHNGRLARYSLCLVLLLCLMSGCQMFHADQTVAVLVRDAETKKPIPTAEVYLCQLLKQDAVAPCRSSGLTQADGIARLTTEPVKELGIQLQAIAPGYLSEKLDVSVDALKKIATAPAARTNEPRRPDFVVEVYAEPAFTVELVIPPGYRGLVKTEIQRQENLSLPPGQRCFRFAVPPSGIVQVVGPSLLQRIAAPDYRARYAGGPLLGTAMDADKIGFRWLKGTGNEHYFVVGTQLDYETHHHRLVPEKTLATSDSWEDPEQISKRGKYHYDHITGKAALANKQ